MNIYFFKYEARATPFEYSNVLINIAAEASFFIVQLTGIVCGIVAPFVGGPPSRVAAIWFPPEGGAAATAIGLSFPNLGIAVSYLFAVWIGRDPEALLWVMRVQTVLARVMLLLI